MIGLVQFPALPLDGSKLLVVPASGAPTPSTGLHGNCTYVPTIPAHRHIAIHINKYLKKKNL